MEYDLVVADKNIGRALKELDVDPDTYISDFIQLQTSYGSRNSDIDDRRNMFEGNHWLDQTGDGSNARTSTSTKDMGAGGQNTDEKDTEFELVLNYLRNATMRYAAMLGRKPVPHVPFPGSGQSLEGLAANRCERFLHAVWGDLWRVWRDVEMDACKLSFGVFQAVWAPFEGEPEMVKVGEGEDNTTRKVYTKCPFKFRSIKPNNFYPVFRTYDTSNDFLVVYRFDPGRLIEDLEERYGVELQATDQNMSTQPTCDLVEVWTRKMYLLVALTRVSETDSRGRKVLEKARYVVIQAGKNPHKRIPFWILQNIRSDAHVDPTDGGSFADLDDISELNKHLEEMMSEQAQEVATHIHSPIVYKSEEHLNDPTKMKFKPGAIFPIGAEEELDAMQWSPDPAGVGGYLDRVFSAIQDLSFLGEAGFGRLAAGMSGIGFKIALTPMEQVLELKLPSRVDALKEICVYLLTEFKNHAKDVPFRGWVVDKLGAYGIAELSADDVPAAPTVEVQFANLLPRDDQLHEQSEVYKWKSGAQSMITTMHNMGVEDPTTEMQRIREELQDPVLNPDHVIKLKQIQQMDQQQQQQQQMQKAQQGRPGAPQQTVGQQPGGGGGGAFGGNAQSGMPQMDQGVQQAMMQALSGMGGGGGAGGGMGAGMNMGMGMGMGGGGGGGMGGIGGVPGGMGGMGGPGAMGMQTGGMPGAGALPGMMSGVGMPGAGGMPGGGMGPMVPPGMMGGVNFPTEEEEKGPGKLAPFLKRGGK